MPNRIIKESICTSDSIDSLTEFQEIFFYRLLVACDDYGRMDARAKILCSRLFPLRAVPLDRIDGALSALADADLIMLYSVDGKPYLQVKTWNKHQQIRAKRSKYPSPEDDTQLIVTCKQMIADDYKCPRNPIQSESNPNPNPNLNPMVADEDARRIQREHDFILNAAENCGFAMSNMVRAKLIDLYAQYGQAKMCDAYTECARHGVTNIAYLEAVLRGGVRKTRPKVNAQDFEQRDYSGVQSEMISDLEKEIAEMNKGVTENG